MCRTKKEDSPVIKLCNTKCMIFVVHVYYVFQLQMEEKVSDYKRCLKSMWPIFKTIYNLFYSFIFVFLYAYIICFPPVNQWLRLFSIFAYLYFTIALRPQIILFSYNGQEIYCNIINNDAMPLNNDVIS